MLNIMRLPKDEAFALAYEMAEQNKETTAFYRFSDFENYYPRRLKTDKLLYDCFLELGGKPLQEHPLSFVLQGSDYLDGWFDCGIVTRIPLNHIDSEDISFTYGDSMAVLERNGSFTMLTKDMLLKEIADFNGTIEEFLANVADKYNYVEVQVWNDECLRV
ncbi:MAG: hypothetical protein K2N38_06930 [Oscillospiraceae bacterium]|nr:hypothetical protein [Oscillospiraceae bacterium]